MYSCALLSILRESTDATELICMTLWFLLMCAYLQLHKGQGRPRCYGACVWRTQVVVYVLCPGPRPSPEWNLQTTRDKELIICLSAFCFEPAATEHGDFVFAVFYHFRCNPDLTVMSVETAAHDQYTASGTSVYTDFHLFNGFFGATFVDRSKSLRTI